MSQKDNEKPVYQTPIVVPLGEMAAADGQVYCENGNSNTDGCGVGTLAQGTNTECNTGTSATSECKRGITAGDECRGGNTPGGNMFSF